MPRDLAVKLSAVTLRPALIDELVVLLPDRDAGFQPSELPPGTRKVWDEHAAHGPITLGGLPAGDIAWLLAHNEWAIETSGLAQPGWPDGAIRQFLLARTRSLLERLAPMPDREELLGRIT
jgi:hypothetical protein